MLTIVVFFCLVPVLLYGFWMFDQLVRLEYTDYRTQWEEDGGPHGFFWVPREAKGGASSIKVNSSFARQRCNFVWLFKTPLWMAQDERALSLLSRFRVMVAVWNIGCLFVLFPLAALRK